MSQLCLNMPRPLVHDSILLGDSVQVLDSLPERSVDLIFADPPYNLQLKNELYRPNLSHVDAVDDEWDKIGGFAEYDAFTRAWLFACRRVLKEDGALWVIGTYHNIFRVGASLQDLGYWVLNDVAWIKSNPMPQFRGVRLCNAHETLIWAKKSEQGRYTFNYKAMKARNGGKQLRSDWYFPICGGPERLRDEGGRLHSTQKPEELLERIIRACSHPGDVVLDPFFGSGTTGAVAKRLGRHYVGIERELAYIEAATQRIAAVQRLPDADLDWPEPKPLQVAFAELLDLGLIAAGDRLRLEKREVYATVQPDGSLLADDGTRGSIHFVGKTLLGTHGCNGWSHWRYNAGSEWRVLDELRARARDMRAG